MTINSRYIYIAVILYAITAYFSIGHNSPDEYYQILQFAAYKLGKAQITSLSWEFYQNARPAMQVWVAYEVYQLFAVFQIANPFIVAFVLRLFSAAVSLIAVFLFISAFLPGIKYQSSKKWFILLSLFSWLIVYNSVRFSSENLSAKFFLLGLSLIFLPRLNNKIIIQLLIGFMMGVALVLRLQTVLSLVAITLWLVVINNFIYVNGSDGKVITYRFYLVTLLGFIIANLVGIFIDRWFYGKWVFSAWNYFYLNLIMGKAASFGAQPWYFYLVIAAFIPYGLVYLLAMVIGVRYKAYNPVSWVVVLFVVGHILINHKEPRFLVPMLPFMPLLISYTIDVAISHRYCIGKISKRIWHYCWYFNCFAVILVAVLPSGTNIFLCKKIYDNYTSAVNFYVTTDGGNIVDFYKRDNLTLHYLKDVKEFSQIKCQPGSVCLLALTCNELNTYKPLNGQIVYDNCPNWVSYINFNDWISRTGLFRIYLVNQI
jgi:phosphatidylinositol glycan class B